MFKSGIFRKLWPYSIFSHTDRNHSDVWDIPEFPIWHNYWRKRGFVTSRFLQRYIYRHSDKVHITTGNSNGKDFWGMEEFQFLLDNCGRCTKTFIRGPSAFIANIDGPVRAIRYKNLILSNFMNKSWIPDAEPLLFFLPTILFFRLT